MGAGAKGTQAGTTNTTQGPAPYMYPYIGTALGQAGNLLQSGGPNYYPGQQVASFNPIQSEAFTNTNRLDNRLTKGSGNPYENAMFDQAAQATQGQLASQFAGSGRDITASMPLRSNQLNNLATDIYGSNYQQDVANAMNAANQQQALGGTIQNQGQRLIDASKAAYNYNQEKPFQNLQSYEQFLGGVPSGSQSQSPYFTNPLANTIGLGLGGLGLYNGINQAGGSKGSKGGTNIATGPGGSIPGLL